MWKIKLKWLRLKCFFTGHGEMLGERWIYEPDYCPKCYMDWPQDRVALPKILNRIYVWLVNRNYDWFNRLDGWLLGEHSNRLPSWWEY